jgi:hypothetical protein
VEDKFFARSNTNGFAGVGVPSADTSVGGGMFASVTGFALPTSAPAARTASDTASGNRNERLFMALPVCQRDE